MPQNLLIAHTIKHNLAVIVQQTTFIVVDLFSNVDFHCSLHVLCIIFLRIEQLSQQSIHAYKDRPEEVLMLALKCDVMSECRSLAPN